MFKLSAVIIGCLVLAQGITAQTLQQQCIQRNGGKVTWKAADGCNTCSCSTTGPVVCTRLICPVLTPQQRCIQRNGGKATWTAADGCNTCRCGVDGLVVCTRVVCPPNYDVTADCTADFHNMHLLANSDYWTCGESANERLDRMEARLATLEADKQASESRMNALASEVQALKKELQKTNGKIARLEPRMAAAKRTLSDQETAMKRTLAVQKTVEMNQTLSNQAADIAQLNITMAQMREERSRDAKKIERIETTLDRVLTGVPELARALAAMDDADAQMQSRSLQNQIKNIWME